MKISIDITDFQNELTQSELDDVVLYFKRHLISVVNRKRVEVKLVEHPITSVKSTDVSVTVA